MYCIHVYFDIKKESVSEFTALVIQNAAESMTEDGCLQFDVFEIKEDRFLLYEIYRSEEDFKNHLESRHFLTFSNRTASMIIDKSVENLNLLHYSK